MAGAGIYKAACDLARKCMIKAGLVTSDASVDFIFTAFSGSVHQVGIGKHFWLNIILTLFGYLPGIIHAVYIIAKK